MSKKEGRTGAHNIHPLFTVDPVPPCVLFALFAIRFMLVTSLKSNAELYVINTVRSGSCAGSPPTISLRSTDAPFRSWFANGLIVSLASKEADPAIRSRASE
jgi:hypothetical protein